MGFRANVLQILENKGINQSELAKRLNKSQPNISMVLKKDSPSYKTVLEFAQALEVEPTQLLASSVKTEYVSPETRFFEAWHDLVKNGKIINVESFAQEHGLDSSDFPDDADDAEEEGRREFQVEFSWFVLLIKHYNVSEEWLFTGKGNMYRDALDRKERQELKLEIESNRQAFRVMKSVLTDKIALQSREIDRLNAKTIFRADNATNQSNHDFDTEDPTEFQTLGDNRYILISPLVNQNAFQSYIAHTEDLNFINDLPKHAVTTNGLPFGIYRSFENLKTVNGYGYDAIFEGQIVTGRRIERSTWRQGLRLKNDPFFVFVTDEEIFTAKIVDHDFREEAVLFSETSLASVPENGIRLGTVKELYLIHVVTDIRL